MGITDEYDRIKEIETKAESAWVSLPLFARTMADKASFILGAETILTDLINDSNN